MQVLLPPTPTELGKIMSAAQANAPAGISSSLVSSIAVENMVAATSAAPGASLSRRAVVVSSGPSSTSAAATADLNDDSNSSAGSPPPAFAEQSGGSGKTYTYRDFSAVPPNPDDALLSHLVNNTQNKSIQTQRFPVKLYAILARKEFSDIVTWMPHGRSWKVLQPDLFESVVMPQFFEYSNYHSFNRLINAWSFRRISKGVDRGSYYHELFLRGLPHLQKHMRRLPKTHRKLPMKKQDEPDFYSMAKTTPLPELENDPGLAMPLQQQHQHQGVAVGSGAAAAAAGMMRATPGGIMMGVPPVPFDGGNPSGMGLAQGNNFSQLPGSALGNNGAPGQGQSSDLSSLFNFAGVGGATAGNSAGSVPGPNLLAQQANFLQNQQSLMGMGLAGGAQMGSLYGLHSGIHPGAAMGAGAGLPNGLNQSGIAGGLPNGLNQMGVGAGLQSPGLQQEGNSGNQNKGTNTSSVSDSNNDGIDPTGQQKCMQMGVGTLYGNMSLLNGANLGVPLLGNNMGMANAGAPVGKEPHSPMPGDGVGMVGSSSFGKS